MEGSGTSLELRLTYSVGLNGILGVLGRSDPRSPARHESGSKPGARCNVQEVSLKQDVTSASSARQLDNWDVRSCQAMKGTDKVQTSSNTFLCVCKKVKPSADNIPSCR